MSQTTAQAPQVTVIELDTENIGAQGSLAMEIEAKLRQIYPPSAIKVSTESIIGDDGSRQNAFDATCQTTQYCPDHVVYAARADAAGISDVVAFADLAESSAQDQGQTEKSLILVGDAQTEVGEAVPVMLDTASRMGFVVYASVEAWLKTVRAD